MGLTAGNNGIVHDKCERLVGDRAVDVGNEGGFVAGISNVDLRERKCFDVNDWVMVRGEGGTDDRRKREVRLVRVLFTAGGGEVALGCKQGVILEWNNADGVIQSGIVVCQGHIVVEGGHD